MEGGVNTPRLCSRLFPRSNNRELHFYSLSPQDCKSSLFGRKQREKVQAGTILRMSQEHLGEKLLLSRIDPS